MKKTIFLVTSLMLSSLFITAQVYKTIDKRTYNDANGTYYIVFTGYGKIWSNSVHAYITFGNEDYRGRRSNYESYGLYPVDMNDPRIVKLQTVPGHILRERVGHLKSNAINVIVKINKPDYDKIYRLVKRYKGQGTYKLLSNDCTSMVIAAAREINLKVPSRNINRWSPQNVMKYISDKNN